MMMMERIGDVKYNGKMHSELQPECMDKIKIRNPISGKWEPCEHWGNIENDNDPYFFGQIGKHLHIEVHKDKVELYAPGSIIFYVVEMKGSFHLNWKFRDGRKKATGQECKRTFARFTVNRKCKSVFECCSFIDAYLLYLENIFQSEAERINEERIEKMERAQMKGDNLIGADDDLPF